MRIAILLVLIALAAAAPALAQTACGINGQCVASASCPRWSTAQTTSECTGGQVCCEPPTCQSGSQTGVCQTASSCATTPVRGLCPGDNSIQCCLPPPPPTSCQINGAFGSCVTPAQGQTAAQACPSGTTQPGLCPTSDQVCCVSSAAQPCAAQGQTGVCQATSATCASGNTVSGLCDSADRTCCLPQAAPVTPTATCSAQGQTGTCQAADAACASGNSVTNVCAGGLRCCLPNAAVTTTTCSAQGMQGQCRAVSDCQSAGGFNVAGLCPGDSSIQCCLPRAPSYGQCTTSNGFVGSCTTGACSGLSSDEDICPGPAGVKCCVTDFTPRTAPATDYGTCVAKPRGESIPRKGTCKSVGACGVAGGPIAGLCPGPNDIQCCPDGPELLPAERKWSPERPTPGTFFGACQSPTGPGSCRPTAQCPTTTVANLCPGGAGITCCQDGGPSFIAGIDLVGGRGAIVSSDNSPKATDFTCLASAGGDTNTFLAVRGWQTTCQLDKTLLDSLAATASAFPASPADVLLYPAFWCGLSPRAQALALLSKLTGASAQFGRVVLVVLPGSGWSSSNLAANLAWVEEAADALADAIGGARVAVMTGQTAWNAIMGASTTSAKLAAYPLWYSGTTSSTDFTDFVSFGGWAYPYAKRYLAEDQRCGLKVQRVWLPSRSATEAAPGAAPAAEPTGAACTYQTATGNCQTTCPANSWGQIKDATLCPTAGQVCCLSTEPTQPTPEPTPPITYTYGLCKQGTGICQPSAQCGATDTKFPGEEGCAAAEGSGDVDVTCCVPQQAIEPPPEGDIPTDDAPADDVPAANANIGRAAASVPRPRSLAATSTSTSAPGARICVNKAGLQLIESFEGFYANFYNDAVGIKTIGFGTACHAYPCNTIRPPITRQQAENILLADMNARYAPCVRSKIRVPLNSNQFSALVSFVYNVGCGGLDGSVGTQLNAGCYSCVAGNLAKWNKAGGKVLAGLTRRRTAEGALFNNGNISPCLDGSGGTGVQESSGQNWGSCTAAGRSGQCIEADDCDGTTYSGLCPGPSTVKCCTTATANPPAPAATACGNGGTCKAASSCNTATNTVRTGLCPGPSTITCCQPKSSAAGDGYWEGATKDYLGDGSSWSPTTAKPKIVLHTTEGSTYEGARSAYSNTHPHFTVTFQRGMFQAYQHCSINSAAKALRNNAGGVETNRARAIQIEIVGQAVNVARFDRRYLDGIASLLRWIEGQLGIPKRAPSFLAYPASYGNSAVRFSGAEWLAFSGTCGHQHVPENSHGDPGNIDINYLMGSSGAVVPGGSTTTPPASYGTCTSAGRTGQCIASASCGGTVISGLCPGPASVACCIENFGPCTVAATATTPAYQGLCQESTKCNGRKVPGLCAGPASVTCCVSDYGSCAQGTTTGRCTQVNDCKGTVVSGLCPGSSTVACCMPNKVTNYGSCSVPYGSSTITGQCIAKSSCAAPNVVKSGLCPGPAEIGCCHNPTPPRTFVECGNNGQCMDVSSCTGTVKRGLCPGASNIACCENPARTAAAVAAPVNSPRSLLAVPVDVNGTTQFGPTAPQWTNTALTICTAGGVQGYCVDGAVGSAICNGVPTFPSTCESPAMCCTPTPCKISNTTAGVCIPPAECANQAGFVTPGFCGEGGVDGATSCCTGVGQAMCDSQGLLACLLADGDRAACAASFNCPPSAEDYEVLTSSVQTAPISGVQAHDGIIEDDGGDGLDDGAAAAHGPAAMLLAAIVAILAAIMQ